MIYHSTANEMHNNEAINGQKKITWIQTNDIEMQQDRCYRYG